MNLEQNIYDTVKEWEIKIGYRKEGIQLYYPLESLLELLDIGKSGFPAAVSEFCKEAQKRLGNVEITKTEEEGRYCIRIPAEGVEYIHQNIPENLFLKAFLETITTSGKTQRDVLAIFQKFSDKVQVKKSGEQEWAFWFEDETIDPYVYHVKEGEFGLEYHRFTRETYKKLFEEK